MSTVILPNLSSPPVLDRYSAGYMYWNYGEDKGYIWQGSYWLQFVPNSGGSSGSTSGVTTIVNGTFHRIDIGGTVSSPIVDISPFYSGQTSINIVGTITSGTW